VVILLSYRIIDFDRILERLGRCVKFDIKKVMQMKWEYKVTCTCSKGLIFDPTTKFNKLGEEGWEAIGIDHKNGNLITLFKGEKINI